MGEHSRMMRCDEIDNLVKWRPALPCHQAASNTSSRVPFFPLNYINLLANSSTHRSRTLGPPGLR